MKLKLYGFFLFILSSFLCGQDAYWQQSIDYKMEIDVDTEKAQYMGKQTITYTNNSPDTLAKVYFHLYWNAFQPGSAMDHYIQNNEAPDKRVINSEGGKTVSKLSLLKPEDYGYQKIISLQQGGQPISYETKGTILEVKLNQKLLPGSKTTFTMNWHSQVPAQIRRSGKNNEEGVALSMTQWYPKMAEYDKNGWQIDEYLSREFHGVWADFDVKIHINNNYVIGGSGKLQNPEGKKSYSPAYKKEKGKTTWHFVAKQIHDFAWAADPDFIVNTKQVPQGPTLFFVYQNNPLYRQTWEEVQEPTVLFFEYMKAKFGPYPWPSYAIVQGGDGGMEYGNCTLVTGNRDFKSLYGVIFHEAAHSWFQHLFATDETLYAWMDEGFTSYADALAQQAIFPDKDKSLNPAIEAYQGYFYLVKSGKEEPLTTLADHFASDETYGLAAYYKGQVLASQLEYIVGKENMDKAWLNYYNNWKFKHPTDTDFRRIVEKTSDMSLKWYFNLWVGTTKTIDYKVKSIADKQITIERIGEIPMPLDVYVQYKDGSSELFYIPLNIMHGAKGKELNEIYQNASWTQLPDWVWTNPQYTITTQKEVESAIIDLTQRLADVEYKNNIYRK